MSAHTSPRSAIALRATGQERTKGGQTPVPPKALAPRPGTSSSASRKRTADMRSPGKDSHFRSKRSDAVAATLSSFGEISSPSLPLLSTSAAEYRELPLSSTTQESFLSEQAASMTSSDFTQVTALPSGEQTLLTTGGFPFLKPSKYPFPKSAPVGATCGQRGAVCEVDARAPLAKKRHVERHRLPVALGPEADLLTLYLMEPSFLSDSSRCKAKGGRSSYSKSPRRNSPRTKQPKTRSLRRQKAQTSLSSQPARRRCQRQGQASARSHRLRTSSPRGEARRRALSPRQAAEQSRKFVVKCESGSSIEVTSFASEASHSTIIVSSPGKSSTSTRSSTRSSSNKSTKSSKPLQDLTLQLGNRGAISGRQRGQKNEESLKGTSRTNSTRSPPSKASRGTNDGSRLQSYLNVSSASVESNSQRCLKSLSTRLRPERRMRTSTPVERSADAKRNFIPSSNETISSVNTDGTLPSPSRRTLQGGTRSAVVRVPETSDSTSVDLQSGVVTSTSDDRTVCISETVDVPSSDGELKKGLDYISRIQTNATKCDKTNEAFLKLSPNIAPPKTSTPILRGRRRAGPLISTPKTPSPRARRKVVVPEERPRPEGCSFHSSPRALAPPEDSDPSTDSAAAQSLIASRNHVSKAGGSDKSPLKGRGKSAGVNPSTRPSVLKLGEEPKDIATHAFFRSSTLKSKRQQGRSSDNQLSSRPPSPDFDPSLYLRPDLSGCSQSSRDTSLEETTSQSTRLENVTFTLKARQPRPGPPRTPTKGRGTVGRRSPSRTPSNPRDVNPLTTSAPRFSPSAERRLPVSQRGQASPTNTRTSEGKETNSTVTPEVSIYTLDSDASCTDSSSSWSALCTPSTARRLSPAKAGPPQPPASLLSASDAKVDAVVPQMQAVSAASSERFLLSSRVSVEMYAHSKGQNSQPDLKMRGAISTSTVINGNGSPIFSPRRRLFAGVGNTGAESTSPKSTPPSHPVKNEIDRQRKNCKGSVRRSWLNYPPPTAASPTPGQKAPLPRCGEDGDHFRVEGSPLPPRARPAQSPRSMKRKQTSPTKSPGASDKLPGKRRRKDSSVSPEGGRVIWNSPSPRTKRETSNEDLGGRRRLSSPMPALRSPLLPQSFSERLGSGSPFRRNSTGAMGDLRSPAAQLQDGLGAPSPFPVKERRASARTTAPQSKESSPP